MWRMARPKRMQMSRGIATNLGIYQPMCVHPHQELPLGRLMKMVYKHDGAVVFVRLDVDEKLTIGRNGGVDGVLLKTQNLREFLTDKIIEREGALLLRLLRDEVNSSGSQCPVAKAI